MSLRGLCVACFVPDEPSHTLMSLRGLCVACFVPDEPSHTLMFLRGSVLHVLFVKNHELTL